MTISGKGDAPEFGKGTPQENLERMVSLARGPKGEKGAQGERGLSSRTARAIVVLFVINALGIGGNLLWTAHEVGGNNHKFCQVISGVTAVPVPAPADPAANPSRVKQYELYEQFVSLGRSLGC